MENTEKKIIKLYTVGGDVDYASWFSNDKMGMSFVSDLDDADLVLFTGGEDINPSLYNEQKHFTTSCNLKRDQKEIEIFQQALELNKKMIGICRGAQLLCALSGGKLIQNMQHPGSHDIVTLNLETKEIDVILPVSSSHHQMMFPFNLNKEDYEILGYTNGGDLDNSSFPKENQNDDIKIEVEIAWFKKTNTLCIQSHPEWLSNKSETVIYLQELLYNFLINENIFNGNSNVNLVFKDDYKNLVNKISKNKEVDYGWINTNSLKPLSIKIEQSKPSISNNSQYGFKEVIENQTSSAEGIYQQIQNYDFEVKELDYTNEYYEIKMDMLTGNAPAINLLLRNNYEAVYNGFIMSLVNDFDINEVMEVNLDEMFLNINSELRIMLKSDMLSLDQKLTELETYPELDNFGIFKYTIMFNFLVELYNLYNIATQI